MMKRILIAAAMLLLVVAPGCGDGPEAPGNLVGAAGTDKVLLSWDSVDSGVETTSYNVYRGTASGSINGKSRIASDLTETTYTDTSLTDGATYYYQVTANNSKGESAASNEVKVSPGGTLPAPVDLVATATGGRIGLTWSAVAGATGYNLYRGTTQTGSITGKSRIASGIAATDYTDITVTVGATYYYQVTAVDSASESPGSNEASATP